MATGNRRGAEPRDEQTVYGVKAALAVLEQRPADVRRIFHAAALRRALAPHLSAAAARHVPYRELDADGLHKVAGTPHHEGLVVVAAPRRWAALTPALAAAAGPHALWLALDRVENPHNLGAIVRTAAFFGVTGLLAGGVDPGAKINAAVLRVAEGAAEAVPLCGAPTLAPLLEALRAGGCRVLGLETDGPLPLSEAVADGLAAGPLVLVLGQEHAGLSAPVRGACDALCVLAGAGSWNSLNVSVSAGVALAGLVRGRPAPAPLPGELPAPAAAASAPERPARRPPQRPAAQRADSRRRPAPERPAPSRRGKTTRRGPGPGAPGVPRKSTGKGAGKGTRKGPGKRPGQRRGGR